jgi:H+-transporting ATPase
MIEAGIIAALLAFNAALGFFQEGRAQATLAAPRLGVAYSPMSKLTVRTGFGMYYDRGE